MNYTIENGIYYKVMDVNTNEFITTGKMEEGNVLSTIHNVEWITEQEFLTLQKDENRK